MNERGKSDRPVVPEKLPNNAALAAAEAVEERGLPEGNTARETRPGRRAGQGVSSDLDRVRQLARRDRDVRFTALLHHVTVDRLRESYRALRPDAAPGVDGVTWREYGQDLEDNLRDLHARVHRGAYRARPTRKVFIPKPDGRLRPLGGRRAGRQDPPAGGGRGAERRLRAGLRWFLLRVSTRTLAA
jgi:RNA-directed DNA polymerase